MEKIGIIGVGAMGSALLERLKLAGARPTAYDCDPVALEAARSLGVEAASSSRAVAQAATIIDVVVRTDKEVLDCALGKNGLLEGAQTNALLLLHSTILPHTTRKVAEAARKRNAQVLDACMLGVPKTVRAGELIFIVGGPTELVERARPHLLKMGKQVIHMGPLGAGNTGKLIKNLTSAAETLMMHEALRLGEAEGLKYAQVLEMLRQVDSGRLLDRWRQVYDPAEPAPTPRIGRNVFHKDVPLAGELARQYGLDIPVIEQLVAAAERLVRDKRRS